MPTENLAEFIFYIVPGFIAIQIYHWRYPVKDRDSFHEIAWSIVWGLVAISCLKWFDKNWFNYFFHSNTSNIPGLRYTLAIFVSGCITGGLFIAQLELRSYLSKRINQLRWLSVGTDTVWERINDSSNEDWATVYLDDGSIYLGWIITYNNNPNSVDQDFLLKDAKRVNEDLSYAYEVKGMGVYINNRDVKRIEFIDGLKK